jgi:two-component system cell cycle response regulator
LTARLLIVDDIPANGRLLEARLAAEYYEVKTVYEGQHVQALAEQWQPDVVLLDVMMPGMDGYEVCRLLKSKQKTSHIPVIMISALKEPIDRRQGLSCGADEFLTKPVEQEILMARLRSIIRLKRLLDEWGARGATATALGLGVNPLRDLPTDPGRVLVVDDLASRAMRVRDVLDQASITTVLVQDEAAALAASESEQFELIAVSLSLMEGDPLRLVAKLRASTVTRDTPLLLIAAADQHDLLISGLDLGASDCLMLPLDETELLLRTTNHIRRKLCQDRLRSDVGTALELAVIDPLTQLFNRRYLTNHLDRLCADAALPQFAVLMIDVDNFKEINDRHGHSMGDEVLRGVADLLCKNLRGADLVSRYGGEEFVVIVGALNDERQALDVAEKLRGAIEQMRIGSIRVTVSIGIALAQAKSAPSAVALIEQADKALYAAKRSGRNLVVSYTNMLDREATIWSNARL